MIQLIAILIMVSGLITTAWLLYASRLRTSATIVLGLLSVFAGLGLILSDRITEITLPGIGTIKAAVESAKTDAEEISAIRERINAQSAAVELVAKEAKDARKLVKEVSRKNVEAAEKLGKLDNSIQEGNRAVAGLKAYTQFSSTLLSAQTDSRPAYDQLKKWSEDSSHPFQKFAAQAVQTIMDQHSPIMFGGSFSVTWDEGVDPKRLTLQQLREIFRKAPAHDRPGILEFLWEKRPDIPKKERLGFLSDVLQNDESLTVVEYAGHYFAHGTKNNLKPLAVEAHLKWWEENKDSVE